MAQEQKSQERELQEKAKNTTEEIYRNLPDFEDLKELSEDKDVGIENILLEQMDALDERRRANPLINSKKIIDKDGFYVNLTLSGSFDDVSEAGTTTTYTARDANNYTIFFSAHLPCELIWVGYWHDENESANVQLEKLTGSETPGNGTAMVNNYGFTPANTVNEKYATDLASNRSDRVLNSLDSVALKLTGSITASTVFHVTAYFKYLGTGDYRT